MRTLKFRGRTLQEVLERIRMKLGEGAEVLSAIRRAGNVIEVQARKTGTAPLLTLKEVQDLFPETPDRLVN